MTLVNLDSLIKFTMLGNLSLPFPFFFSPWSGLLSNEMKFEIKFKSYKKFNDQIKKKKLSCGMKFKTKLKSYQRIKAQKKIKWCMARTHQSMRKLATFGWHMQHPLKFNEVLPQGLQNLLNELSSFLYTTLIFLFHPLGINVWFLLLLHLWTKKPSLFPYYWIRSLHN